jgi:hypothetical protein
MQMIDSKKLVNTMFTFIEKNLLEDVFFKVLLGSSHILPKVISEKI